MPLGHLRTLVFALDIYVTRHIYMPSDIYMLMVDYIVGANYLQQHPTVKLIAI